MATGPTPIVPAQPQSVRSVVRKYTSPDPLLASELSRATPQAIRALRRYDASRIERGYRPLTQPQTAVAARAVSTGESSVGEPNESMVGDFVRNVKELAGGLPRLPQALGAEILDLPSAPEKVRQGINEADNPIEAVGNIAQAPGIRMIPGAFVADQFGTGGKGVAGLTDDPLFTVLDVLPYASKAASLAPGAKAAARVVEEAGTGERVGRFSSAVRYTGRERTGPIPPNVTTTRGATVRNALEPTRLGRILESGGARFRGTGVGNLAAEMWGDPSMKVSQIAARNEAELNVKSYARNADDAALMDVQLKAGEAADTAKAAGVSEARLAEIDRNLRTGDLDRSRLTAPEREYVKTYEELLPEVTKQDIAEGRLVELEITTPEGRTTTEVYTPKQAKRILDARDTLAKARVVDDAARAATGEATFTGGDLAAKLRDLADTDLPVAAKRKAARVYIESARAQGFDVSRIDLSGSRKADLNAALRAVGDVPVAKTRAPLADIRRAVMPLARTDTTVSRLVGFLDGGDLRSAASVARRLAKRKTFTGGLAWSDIADDLNAYARRDAAAFRLAEFKPAKTLKAAERRVMNAERSTMPARFYDLAGREVSRRVIEQLPDLQAQGLLTAEQASDAARLLAAGVAEAGDLPPALKRIYQRTSFEVKSTWLDMVDEGHNPTFVHRVKSSRAGQPVRVTGTPTSIGHVKERAFDFGNTVNDVMVALDHQAAEILMRRGYERTMHEIASAFGRDELSIRNQYREWAERAVQRNPKLSYREHLDNLISRNWRKFDVPEATIDGELIPARRVYVPRDVAATVDRLAPKDLGVIGRTFDPVMKVFRTALLPLSPRWHVYSITGGAIMLTAEQGLGAWKHFGDAWRFATGRGLSPELENAIRSNRALPQMAGGVEGRALREAQQWGRSVDLSTKSGRAVAAWETSAGRTLRRWWDEAGSRGQRFVDRSYAVNEMFDDMYRSMAYLHGTDKALAKGLGREAAEAAGAQAARRVLQSWDRLTPIERTVIRNVFPFYSWAKHLMGFVTRYPFDHPLRTSVTASLVQAELDDYGTGLPQMMFSLLDVTGPAGRLGLTPDEGKRITLNLDGVNPFRDIGSYATLVGFVASPFTGEAGDVGSLGAVTSQMNPAAQLFLRGIGVDPAEGLPDLYGNVTYDPSTGGLRVSTGFNPVTDIAQSIVPQTRALFDVAGLNRDFQTLVQSNPDAAMSRLRSSLGIPAALFPVQRDMDAEIIKAETRRLEDVQRTRSKALRTGNLDLLDRYPQLAEYKRQLEAAKARGDLEAFTPPDADEVLRQIEEGERRSPLGG